MLFVCVLHFHVSVYERVCVCALMHVFLACLHVVLYSSVYYSLYLLIYMHASLRTHTVCVRVLAQRPTVYMGHCLRNRNPMFGPTYSLGFHSSCLAKLMATSIMTSPQHLVIGLQTPGLSANHTLLW